MNLTVTLDVSYDLNGEDPREIMDHVRYSIEAMIGNGGLSGGTEAEVDEYDLDIITIDTPPSPPGDA